MVGYRGLVRLYPRSFRDEFAEDLVQLFDDLRTDRGSVQAWRIAGLDLVVTLPRLHLERIMNQTHTTVAINVTLALLALAGVVGIMTGIYPASVFFVAALGLAIAQRSALARSIRVQDPGVRRRRLRIGATLGAVFVISYVIYIATIGDSWTVRETVLALVGTLSMVGSAVYLVVGLLTPRAASTASPPA